MNSATGNSSDPDSHAQKRNESVDVRRSLIAWGFCSSVAVVTVGGSFIAYLFLSWQVHATLCITGLILTFGSAVYLKSDRAKRAKQLFPAGLVSVFPVWRRMNTPMAVLFYAVFFGGIVGVASTMLSPPEGMAGPAPLFGTRDRYVLSNHGKETEVSRSRFIKVGLHFAATWHALMLAVAAATLRYVAYRTTPFGIEGSEDKPKIENTSVEIESDDARKCPQCGLPVPPYRDTCRNCRHQIGRAL